MLWQNASARTVATARPAASRVPGQLEQRADRGRPLALLAEGREVVLADQQRRTPRSWRPGRAAAARPARGRAPAGRRSRARRRSGRRSAATARRSGRRSRRGGPTTRRTRTSGSRMPLSRRSSASSGGSVERPAEAASSVLVDVGVHDLAARVDPGVGAPGADQAHLGRPQRGRERRRRARPGPSAARAGRPSRGSRCRRRRGRSGVARDASLLRGRCLGLFP